MIPKLRYRTVKKLIHPPEADHLASEFSSCARQVEAYKQEVDRSIADLNYSWSGNQKEVFMEGFAKIPSRMTFMIEMFQNQAKAFQSLLVTVEETVPVMP